MINFRTIFHERNTPKFKNNKSVDKNDLIRSRDLHTQSNSYENRRVRCFKTNHASLCSATIRLSSHLSKKEEEEKETKRR